jgi:alpha-glucosidase
MRRNFHFGSVAALLISVLWSTGELRAQYDTRVASPNGEIEFRLFSAQPEGALFGRIGYQVFAHGKPLLAVSWLGLDIRDQEPFLGENPGFMSPSAPPVKTDRFNSVIAQYMQNGSLGRRLDIEIRAFNDGIAFRYVIPRSTPVEEILIRNEATQFNFADPSLLAHLTPQPDYDLPFVVQSPSLGWVAIAEAGTESISVQYPRTYLVRTDAGMITSLARSTKEPSVAYVGPTPLIWPWRVVVVGLDHDHLTRSETLRNLNHQD